MDIFEEMKNRISMRDLLESYGIYPYRGNNIYRCPFHGDKKPSANIVKNCEKFHCFSENKTWDIFDFVADMEKCDLKKATQILDTKFNLGLLRELSHKEKLELDRKRKEREKAKAEKLAQQKLEQDTLNKIADRLRFCEKVQETAHLTRGEFKRRDWKWRKIFFTSLKEQEKLMWLYNKICGSDQPESKFDYIYPADKRELLEMIKSGAITISPPKNLCFKARKRIGASNLSRKCLTVP